MGVRAERTSLVHVVYVAMLLFFISQAHATTLFYSPTFSENASVGEAINISILNKSSSTNQTLFYKLPNNRNWFSVGKVGETFTIPAANVTRQGIYEFYFEDSTVANSRFPSSGSFKMYVNSDYDKYRAIYEGFSLNDSVLTTSCHPYGGNYTCGWEHWQSLQIERFVRLYAHTQNNTYLTTAQNLISANWTTFQNSLFCNYNEGDFNCESIGTGGDSYTGAERQGEVIASLWNAYSYTRNETIRQLAINYTQGSAGECDVWTGDYDCGDSTSQGIMIRGYSIAYLHSGNDTYLDKAYNLFSSANTSDQNRELVRGLSWLYAATGNETVATTARTLAISLVNDCVTTQCSVQSFATSILFSTDVYTNLFSTHLVSLQDSNGTTLFVPFDHAIYRSIFDKLVVGPLTSGTDGSCSSSQNDYQCSKPHQQALMTKAYMQLLYNTRNTTDGFFDVKVLSSPQANTDINLSVKLKGEANDTRIFYKDPTDAGAYTNATLSSIGFVSVPFNFSSSSLFLEYYFSDDDGNRYPDNNSFIVGIPIGTPEIDGKLSSVTYSNPINYCSPHNASGNPYSCRYDYMQGEYLRGLSPVAQHYQNSSLLSIVGNLSSRDIDTSSTGGDIGFYSSCDPYEKDYFCTETAGFINDPKKKPGVYRVGKLISGYVSAYRATGNYTFVDNALALAYSTWDECNVLTGDYNCETSDNQGSLIDAFSELYEVTDDGNLLDITQELVATALTMNASEDLMRGLVTSYENFGNTSVKTMLEAYANNELQSCTNDFNCTASRHWKSVEIAWNLYRLFDNSTYYNLGNNILQARPLSPQHYCDPYDGNPTYDSVKNRCEYPDEQGALSSALLAAKSSYVLRAPPQIDVMLTAPSSGQFFALTTVSCDVNNTDTIPLASGRLDFSTDLDIVNISSTGTVEDTTVLIDNLAAGQTIYTNITINMTKGGINSFRCFIFNYEEESLITVNDIGRILAFTQEEDYIGNHTNNTLTFSVENDHDFGLENVTLTLLSEVEILNISSSDAGWTITNTTLSYDLLFSGSINNITVTFNVTNENTSTLELAATSAYGGTHNETFSFYTLENNMTRTLSSPNETRLYDPTNITYNITNEKPFLVRNITLSLNLSESDVVINQTYLNNTLVSPANTTLFISEILPNQSVVAIYEIIPRNESGNETMMIRVDATTSEGLNITDTTTIFISDNILDIDSQDQTATLGQNTLFSIPITNDGVVNQTNISITFGFDTSSLQLVDVSVDPIVEEENTTGQIATVSVRQTANATSALQNITQNDSSTYTITLTNETITDFIAANITIDQDVSLDEISSAQLTAVYSAEGVGNTSNVIAEITLLNVITNVSEKTNCVLLLNTTENTSACNITQQLANSSFSSGEAEKSVIVNYTVGYVNSTDYSVNTTNVSLSFDFISLNITYQNSTALGTFSSAQKKYTLYALGKNETENLRITTNSSGSSTILTLDAQSLEGGKEVSSLTITASSPTSSQSGGGESSDGGGGAGGGSLGSTEKEDFLHRMKLDLNSSRFFELEETNKTLYTDILHLFGQDNGTQFNRTAIQTQLDCLEGTREIVGRWNKTTNRTAYTITLLVNNTYCDETTTQLHIYERVPTKLLETVSQKYLHDQTNASIAFVVPTIVKNETIRMTYSFSSLSEGKSIVQRYNREKEFFFIPVYVESIEEKVEQSAEEQREGIFAPLIGKVKEGFAFLARTVQEISLPDFRSGVSLQQTAKNLLYNRYSFVALTLIITTALGLYLNHMGYLRKPAFLRTTMRRRIVWKRPWMERVFAYADYAAVRAQKRTMQMTGTLRNAHGGNKAVYSPDPFSRILFSLHLKSAYVSKLAARGDIATAELQMKELLELYEKNKSILQEASTKELMEKVLFLTKEIESCKDKIALAKSRAARTPALVVPGQSVVKTEKTVVDHPEYTAYLKVKELQSLLESGKLEEIERRIGKVESDIGKIDELERKEEKRFLQGQLMFLKAEFEKAKNASLKYKFRKQAKGLLATVREKFQKN